ncbi:MAG: 2Fe-2S iron-sulfur cluster-binding protein [Acidobacteriota bacterium]
MGGGDVTLLSVTILPEGMKVLVPAGASLLEAALSGGIEILHSCGGVPACTTCRVEICAGKENLSRMSLPEQELLRESGILHSHRLACQARVSGDVRIKRDLWRRTLDSPGTRD